MRPSFKSLAFKRVVALAAGMAALCVVPGVHATMTADSVVAEPKALGLIVKLKDKVPQPLIKLKVSQRPADGAQSQRLRLAAAANRHRVGFTAEKPTAFGAHLVHSGALMPLAEAEAEAARLRLDPDVEWVVVNRMEKQAAVSPLTVTTRLPSNPGLYPDHFWLKPFSNPSLYGVADFASAWSRIEGLGASSLNPVVLAVLDTGKLEHPDVTGRILPGYDFVSQHSNDGDGLDPDPTDPGDYMRTTVGECEAQTSSWHGFQIISMLTAPHDSTTFGPGILAPVPGAVVMPVRIGGGCGAALSDIIEGLLWAAGVDYQGTPTRNPNPARVINLSFGSVGTCQTSSSADVLYRQTVATLTAKGVVLVASAGNGDGNGTSGYAVPSRPASCPGVLAVTSLRSNGAKAAYANLVSGDPAQAGYYGIAVAGGDSTDSIDRNLELLLNGGSYEANGTFAKESAFTCVYNGGSTGPCISQGTSFAAPQVAGLAALMMAVAPNLSGSDVRTLIRDTARAHASVALPACSATQLGACACTTSTCGAGVLNADEAIRRAALVSTGIAYASADASATYFVPDRLNSSSRGGGGGGASDVGMLALLAALATWMLGAAAWQRRKARQAKPAFVTTGKR